MDYSKNYFQATFLVDRIRKAAAEGNKTKLYSGLGARMQENEKKLEDFDTIKAQYMQSIQDMFEPLRQETQSYLDAPTSSPFPERNPERWNSASLIAPISAEVTDESVRRILNTIKGRESSGDYSIQNKKGSASGGYQFINDTWRALTKKYGVGTEYKSAKEAPPEVQDMVAASYVKDILAENNNDVTKVPVVWYTGNAAGQMSEEALAANEGLTPAEYQDKWMRAYSRTTGDLE